MGNIEILPRLESAVFCFNLKSVGKKSRRQEAMDLLKAKYPVTPDSNRIVLRRNVEDVYICIVLPDLVPGKKYISSTLYGVNHAKKYGGDIAIAASGFTEIVRTKNGKFMKSQIVSKDSCEDCVVVSEPEIINRHWSMDLVCVRDPKAYAVRIAVLLLFCIFIAIFATVFAGGQIKKKQGEAVAQKELEEINREKISARKEAENRLELLRAEYEDMENSRLQNMYFLLNILYRCVGNKSVIENLTIEKDNFSMDVTVEDSVQVLSRLEGCNEIIEVKMNRTTVQDKTERVNFTGKFLHIFEMAPAESEVDDQIKFYSSAIESAKERFGLMEGKKLSDYAGAVRKVLHESGCGDQYLQYRISSGIAVLECFVESDSKKILSFISEVQGVNFMDGISADIQGLHIRNRGNPGLQATIKFWTGIRTDAGEVAKVNAAGNIEEESINETPEDLSKIFKGQVNSTNIEQKTSTVMPRAKQTVPEKKSVEAKPNVRPSEPEKILPVVVETKKSLIYIGNAKFGDSASVIFKDTEMDVIYTLPLLATEPEKKMDFCVMAGEGLYSVYIAGNCYRVRRTGE